MKTSYLKFSFHRNQKPRGFLSFWLVLPIVVGIILAGFIVFPFVKHKLRRVPVYPQTLASEYINIEKLQEAINQDENIEVQNPGEKALLAGARWVPQTFNNCAPATVSIALQYFGYNIDQNTTKSHLRTNSDDKNVFTYEIATYLKANYNIESKLFYNGDIQRIKMLIANGFYVVVEDWLHPNEDIGHVTILRGFDDNLGVFIADDSYIGINIMYKYDEFDRTQWKPFNREYLPLYRGEQEKLLRAIIGEDWDEAKMYEKAVKLALTEIEQNPNDMYAYFNLGTSYYELGEFEKAREAFERSRSLGWPKRMLWYQIQSVQTYNKLGEYEKALELARIGLSGNDSFAELHYESAEAYKGLGEIDKARSEAEKALFYAPNFESAKDLLHTL